MMGEADKFTDTVTLDIKATWLDLFEPYQYISSPKQPVPNHEELNWWIHCYPNGANGDCRGKVGVAVFTSDGNFELSVVFTIQNTDITTGNFTKQCDGPFSQAANAFTTHNQLELLAEDVFQDGTFVIQCDVVFNFSCEAVLNNLKLIEKPKSFEDNCIVKIDRDMLTFKPGRQAKTKKQVINGITWWIVYQPNGETEDDQHYVGVYFHVFGGPIITNFTCSMIMDGVKLEKTGIVRLTDDRGEGFRFVSHKQFLLAVDEEDNVDIKCHVTFYQFPAVTITATNKTETPAPTVASKSSSDHSHVCQDTISISMLDIMLDNTANGDFDTTPMTPVKGSDKHQWRLQVFPAGDFPRAEGYVSLYLDALTTEVKPVQCSGVVKIDGTNFEKKFSFAVEDGNVTGFPKLISHDKLKMLNCVSEGAIKFVCEANFETG
uniref:MATH domain-containing protein n=1 Tax=Panagrellus redivivus TaxID=6233 RepID=A0A7E4VKV1_PANRE